MSRAARRIVLLACALCTSMAAIAAAAESTSPLRVCLEADHPPFSSAKGSDPGIDHEISAHVAAALGRPLRVEWFRGWDDDEVPMGHGASRLLTSTGCDLIAGYPLTQEGLMAPAKVVPPPPETGEWARADRLLASRPYLSLPLTVVSVVEGLTVDSLDDLVGHRVAVERGSLASVIANVTAGASLRAGLLRVSPASDAIFVSLETGAADTALVERHRFELYRARWSATRIQGTGYRHPLGVNTGFVGRAPALIAEVDAAIQNLVSNGFAAEIVEARGLGYSTPSRPEILPRLTPRLLAQPDLRP